FAALLTFVHDGTVSDVRAVELMTSGPAKVLRMEGEIGCVLGEKAPADLCLVDPNRSWTVTHETLHGKSKNSAFLGREFKGKVAATFMGGELRFTDGIERA
ncbi:MAG: dihydroorotase, partial [Myxococcota bacterium]